MTNELAGEPVAWQYEATSEATGRVRRYLCLGRDVVFAEAGWAETPLYTLQAATALTTNPALIAENERLKAALERCAQIVERNLGRQDEKIADVVQVARAALTAGASHAD